ncbi:MAG: glutamate 5-kinase, partial [Acetivibrio ethanolgignens]
MRSLNEKKRIVVKLGTSTLTHEATGELDLIKMEKLVRILTDLNNQGKEIVVVSSGAIGVGRKAIGLKERPKELSVRQACAAIGQARLMMVY